MTRLADRIIFWLAASIAFLIYSQALYQYGYDHGRDTPKKCAAPEAKKMSYDTSKREMRRWIRYELAKGNTL